MWKYFQCITLTSSDDTVGIVGIAVFVGEIGKGWDVGGGGCGESGGGGRGGGGGGSAADAGGGAGDDAVFLKLISVSSMIILSWVLPFLTCERNYCKKKKNRLTGEKKEMIIKK